ncbi:unnamed protein product [Ectocarpus sp. CCAP 1310/34]|nr:unnamed protein product [Ectocarpus sp. CCAP 1310/34]
MASNKIDIHEAAGDGNLAEVRAFLKAGGIVDKRDSDRWTPLMLSVREGHLEVARQLLRSGAALEAKDGDKWTAMHIAAANGQLQCCQLLLDRGGNPRAVDENRRTPLHWATSFNANSADIMAFEILMGLWRGEKQVRSFRYGYTAVVELLLKRGADANFKDAEGKTPGDVVGSDLSEDSREIALTLLKEHAARVKNTKQRRGSCPAIPRTMMATVVHAAGTGTINGASVPAAAPLLLSSPTAPSHKPGTLLPLPSVVVTNKNAGEIDAETAVDGANSNQAGGQATRHISFSAADRIRDHSSTGKNEGRYAEISSAAALVTAAAEETGVSPETPLTTSEVGSPSRATSAPGQTPGRASDPKKRVPITGGATTTADTAGGIGSTAEGQDNGCRDNKNDSEVFALRQALKAAEERARASENSLSQIEERRLREEARAQRLEERVAELEKVLSERSTERQDA